MTFPRSSLRRLAPVAFAVFFAGAIVPRAAFYAHHHAGGDHPHVHGDRHEVHEHAHPHHASWPVSRGPMLEDGAPGDGSHVHWQSPFQRATTCPTTILLRGDACVPLAAAAPQKPHTDELPPARSRAPPPLLPA